MTKPNGAKGLASAEAICEGLSELFTNFGWADAHAQPAMRYGERYLPAHAASAQNHEVCFVEPGIDYFDVARLAESFPLDFTRASWSRAQELFHRCRLQLQDHTPRERWALRAQVALAEGMDVVTKNHSGCPIAPLVVVQPSTELSIDLDHATQVRGLATARTTTRLVIGTADDAGVYFWDGAIGQLLSKAVGVHNGKVRSLAMLGLPTGNVIAASGATDATIRFWDPMTGAERLEALDLAGIPWAVDLAITAKEEIVLAVATEDFVQVWACERREPLSPPLRGAGSNVQSLAWVHQADGTLMFASANWDGEIARWTCTGERIGNPLSVDEGMQAVAFCDLPVARRGLVAASGKSMVIFDADSGCQIHQITTALRTTDPIESVAASGATVSVGNAEGLVTSWSLVSDDPEVQARRSAERNPRVAHGLLPDGRTVVASSGGRVARIWHPKTRSSTAGRPTGDMVNTMAVTFGPGEVGRESVVTADPDGHIRFWDAETGDLTATSGERHTHQVSGLAATTSESRGWLVASASWDQTVRLWDPTGAQIGPTHDLGSWVTSIGLTAVSGGEPLVVAATLDGLFIVEATTGNLVLHRPTSPGSQLGVVTSSLDSEGRYQIAEADTAGGIRLWHPHDDGDGLVLRGHSAVVKSLVFGVNRERHLLFSSGEDAVRVWDATTGQLIGDPIPHSLGFEPHAALMEDANGQTVLALSGVRSIDLWDLQSRLHLASIPVAGGVHTMAANGDRLAFGQFNGFDVWQLTDLG